jgi:HD-like signal output (HDOD) protein
VITRKEILAAIEGADQLPPFPDVVIRVEQELSKPDASINKLVTLLEQDMTLVAQLLRVANSAFYGGKTRITSIRDAAVRLGVGELQRIVCAAACVGRYRQVGGMNAERFWGHSLAVAMAARAVCRFCKQPVSQETHEAAYVAGLLHDLGALALMHWFAAEFAETVAATREQGGSTSECELARWGIDHGEVGGLLAERWNLPQLIQHAITYHHQPWLVAPSSRPVVRLVHIADFICTNQGFGREETGLPTWFDAEAWDALGLSIDDSQAIIAQVRADGEKSVVLARVLTL